MTKSIKSTFISCTVNSFVAVTAVCRSFMEKVLSLTLCLRTAILGSHKLSYPLTVFGFLSILCLIGDRGLMLNQDITGGTSNIIRVLRA